MLFLVLGLRLSACHLDDPGQSEALLSDGVYAVTRGFGYAVADEQRILAITAKLNRAAGQLVFTLADGSQKTLSFTPRPKGQWPGDCATMSSAVLDEIADLAPAPLVLESMTFTTPLVFAKCAPGRMIVSNMYGEGSLFLVMDLK